ADQLGDLLSALSSLNEIPDLLDSLRRKLYWSSMSWELCGKLCGLHHFCIPSGTAPSSYASGGSESETGGFSTGCAGSELSLRCESVRAGGTDGRHVLPVPGPVLRSSWRGASASPVSSIRLACLASSCNPT